MAYRTIGSARESNRDNGSSNLPGPSFFIGDKMMNEVRLRLTPSEFGALWTHLRNGGDANGFHFGSWRLNPGSFITMNHIELIEEYNPDLRPRYENGKLTVDPLFHTWVKCLNSDNPIIEAVK